MQYKKPITARVQGFVQTCRQHPAEVDESYLQHMQFAGRMSFRLLKASAAALLHSVVPACCETTASREICAMHDEITRRHTNTASVPESGSTLVS